MPTTPTPTVGTDSYRVELIDITQRFGNTTVLHGVTVRLQPGEIHSLVGQNGAGKSTLTKILGGVHPDHGGTVRIDGVDCRMSSPREAGKHGVGIIFQELSLIPSLTVAENILLGMEPGRGYSRARTLSVAKEIVARVEMLSELPLDVPVATLSTGMQQRVEIAKALSRDARVLVMDEPTARLSGPERDDLRNLILQLAADGITVIYISHFLEEIFSTCQSVTVLRNGHVVDSGPTSSYTMSSLTRAMLNEALAHEELDQTPETREFTEAPLLSLEGVGGPRLHGVDLDIRPGEIVGVAGLVGSGRTRLAKTVVGAEPSTAGEIRVRGRRVRLRSPREALRLGMVLIPESRKTEGIVGIASAHTNMIGMAVDRRLSRLGLVNRREGRRVAARMFTELEIRPAAPGQAAESFSGGNQQKLLMARALLAQPNLIVADQPTAGVDVGTKAQIHHLLKETAANGTALLIVSDDLEELLALSDRILVMRNGRVIAERSRRELNRQKLVDVISAEEPDAVATQSQALVPSPTPRPARWESAREQAATSL